MAFSHTVSNENQPIDPKLIERTHRHLFFFTHIDKDNLIIQSIFHSSLVPLDPMVRVITSVEHRYCCYHHHHWLWWWW
jgi:hypothetical protein